MPLIHKFANQMENAAPPSAPPPPRGPEPPPNWPSILLLAGGATLTLSKRGKPRETLRLDVTIHLWRDLNDAAERGEKVIALGVGGKNLSAKSLRTLNAFLRNDEALRMFERAYNKRNPERASIQFTAWHWEFLCEYLDLEWEEKQ